MRKSVRIENWRLALVPNAEVVAERFAPTRPDEVEKSGKKVMKGSVPGNFELDLMREGLLDDVYVGANSFETLKLENLHLYYGSEFTFTAEENCDAFLVFEGVDTAAEIFLDGEKIGFVENMLHAHRFSLNGVKDGEHALLVHILPSTIYSRQFEVPAMCFAQKYNQDGLQLRKAPYMMGWDIMPRLVSGGIWKPVKVEYVPKSRIVDPFTSVMFLKPEEDFARIATTLRVITEADYITDFTLTVEGKCGEKRFYSEHRLFSASVKAETEVVSPALWWPKNYGEPNLYDVTLTLYYQGVECDRVSYRTGLRTVRLNRTSCAGDDGDFSFYVNEKRIYVMGSCWVPCDAFPSRHDDYTLRNVRMIDEEGCNMVRCWGGNVYPSDLFYDYCDAHGIMVWQDFSMACGHYPGDDRLASLMRTEVREVVKALRNHPSLSIWVGDNECDCFIDPFWGAPHTPEQAGKIDPNFNRLTRDVIRRELRDHDATRPYLPSSPFVDEVAFLYGGISEDHLWGPRNYFKSDFYAKAKCHFVSETGYHGCPSPASIKKFIPRESLPTDIHEIETNPDWVMHATGIEPSAEDSPYAFRLGKMISQVNILFTDPKTDLYGFARQSQIAQAEANKFLVEYFRRGKWRRMGCLIWNMADGWPQVSDAIVDWYGCKKIAYHYVKRSQTPFCMMFDEPDENGMLTLVATNDSRDELAVEYTVENVVTGKTVLSGKTKICPDEIVRLEKLPDEKNAFYAIRWTSAQGDGLNHFVCRFEEKWDSELYISCMKKLGYYDEFEGFEE